MIECRNCAGVAWVCEDHRDRPWGGLSGAPESCDCGGAGAPCPVCSSQMACATYTEPYRLALEEIAARGPAEKPDGPYDPLYGGYCSDNYGDVIAAASDEANWFTAQIARTALGHTPVTGGQS